jgi:hypothetical protein
MLYLFPVTKYAPFCVSMTSKMQLSTMNKLSMWELPVALHMDDMF